MALTEIVIKQAKPEEKTYLMSDGKGLSLEVRPNGRKYWIIRYWIARKEHRTSAGVYPEVTLKQARDKNYEFRKALAAGKPVGFDRETFSSVAEEWLQKRIEPKCVKKYAATVRSMLAHLVFPDIGNLKFEEITSGILLQLCRKIENRGALALASRIRGHIGQVFNYAIATDRTEVNPALALRGALQIHKVKHLAAITKGPQIGLLIRHIEAYPRAILRCALKFSALVFCRPGEIRHAEWQEIDWEKGEWTIPAEKMKMKRTHLVPLAKQTIEVLKELRLHTGEDKWLFPSARCDGNCMSDTAVRLALRTIGYTKEEMTPHGFRSMASTNLNEARKPDGSRMWSIDAIELQLSHVERNSVRGAYNHAEYLPERMEMMQWWADRLDELKKQTGENSQRTSE